MKTHHLKCWPEYFQKVVTGEKNFECRFNDRDFKEGDQLILQEFDNETKLYTGKQQLFEITYILKDYEGLKEKFVVLAINFVI